MRHLLPPLRAPLLALSLATATLGAAPAAAQVYEGGVPLSVTETFRGPYQHAVVGSSLVRPNGAVLPSAGADLALPDGARVFHARLFWMGSRSAPDGDVRLVKDGRALDVSVPAGDCLSLTNVNGRNGAHYYQCSAVVTSFLDGESLSGRYELEGASFDTLGVYGSDSGDAFAANLYGGGFALVVVYTDPADTYPRAMQIVSGLRAQDGGGSRIRTHVAAFDPLEISPNGGRLTYVGIEGDPELAGDERIDLCRGTCDGSAAVPANALAQDLVTSPGNPVGTLFNESITSEVGATITNVTETNGFDLDTFDLAPAYVAGDRAANQFFADTGLLSVSTTTNDDMTIHNVVIVEITDFDQDGDGLSNIEEDEIGTDPLVPDTDADGLLDGTEVRGGDPANPDDPTNQITNPLDPDSDDDRLCDGSRTVAGVCAGGEDVNDDGVRGLDETSPNDPDSDDDLLLDGTERLDGDYPGPLGPRTDPLDPDSDDDGLSDGQEDASLDGLRGADETDPTDPDSDDDGILDAVEVGGTNGTDPLDPDSDDDRLCDGGVDVAGVCVGVDVGEDLDADGARSATETDPLDPDTDGDGISDGTERLDGDYPGPLGPRTDPLAADTDGDGFDDGVEDVDADGNLEIDETDPTDPASFPGCVGTAPGCAPPPDEPLAPQVDDVEPVEPPKKQEVERLIAGSALYSGCAAAAGGDVGALALVAFVLALARRRGARRRP